MSSLHTLKHELQQHPFLDAEAVAKIEAIIYEDARINEEECNVLFELNNHFSDRENDQSWTTLFVKGVTDFVLVEEHTPGVLDEEEAKFIIDKINADGKIDHNEKALLISITTNAEETSEEFRKFVFEAFKRTILTDDLIDDEEISSIKSIIYGTGGAGGLDIHRSEAEWLFELHQHISHQYPLSKSWKALMVDAISRHVLEDEESPDEVDEEEVEWLRQHLLVDGNIDDVGQAIIDELHFKARSIKGEL